MTANIVQPVDRPIIAANDKDRVSVHLKRKVVARLLDFARVPGEEPAPPPDRLDVRAIHLFVRIKGLRQRPAGPALSDQRLNPVQHGFEATWILLRYSR